VSDLGCLWRGHTCSGFSQVPRIEYGSSPCTFSEIGSVVQLAQFWPNPLGGTGSDPH
jgi:hypothetical protein